MVLHENRVMHDQESPEQKAIRLLNRQLEELKTVRSMNHKRAEFKAWHDTTTSILERFLGSDSEHTTRFQMTRFSGAPRIQRWRARPLPPDYVSNEDRTMFQRGCETVEVTLKAAIRSIEDFGVHAEQPKPAPARRGKDRNGGGVTQTFNAPVSIHNLAIAADHAKQKIGNMGDETSVSLREIATLLPQSMDLTPSQVQEALKGIEVLGTETQKPPQRRDWKSILNYGSSVLAIADKAADLGHKLAQYTPQIVALIEAAKQHL